MRKFLLLSTCLGWCATPTLAQQTVQIDVDPWNPANEVWPDDDRAIVISIQSDAGVFDAAQVDPLSIRFGTGAAVNFSVPALHDIDGDSDTDIVVAFRTQEAGILCTEDTVSITGDTYAGDPFTGNDMIATPACPGGCHPVAPPQTRISNPIIIGDSHSEDPADWWNLSQEFDPVDFDVYAIAGEELGRHNNNPARGMVRNAQTYLDTASTTDSVIIFGGVNDARLSSHAGEMKFALTDMVTEAKSRTNIRDVIVVGPTPFGNFSGFGGWGPAKQEELEEYMNWLPSFVAAEGIHLVDVYSVLGDPVNPTAIKAEYEDGGGLHFNVLGALQIAAAVDAKVITARAGPKKGWRPTVPQAIGWDTARRTYDGAVVNGSQLTWSRTVSEQQSLPASSYLPATGKWYVELKITAVDTPSDMKIGLVREATHDPSWSGGLGSDGAHPSIDLNDSRGISNGVSFGVNRLDIEAGTVIGIAYDGDADLAWINVNGHWQEQTAVNALPDLGMGTGGISVDDAADYLIAIESTATGITVEFPTKILAGHIPEGFGTLQ
jgi:hypothetical protein